MHAEIGVSVDNGIHVRLRLLILSVLAAITITCLTRIGALKRGPKEMSTRMSYVRALKAAGLLDPTSTDDAYGKWIHRFGQHEIGLHIGAKLGLEAGTYDGKRRNTTRI
jgi:hypothetical protein